MQETKVEKWLCRWSPTLGALEGTAEEVWGTEDYDKMQEIELDLPASELDVSLRPSIFFGLYGLPDFYKLWRHKGRKCILWAGTDIIHFKNGYWLEEGGGISLEPWQLARWINLHCESYVENEVEQRALEALNIQSEIVPSFLGDINDFPLSFRPQKTIQLYTSVSGDNFKQYGWDYIPKLAKDNPEVEFHLYGNTYLPFSAKSPDYIKPPEWMQPNIFIHGRISKEEMNREIKEMTGALRLTEFDGFSEIIAKSLLWGQWPVSFIEYPHTFSPDQISSLRMAKSPNVEGRNWLLSVVNKFPWNNKK